MYTSVCVLLIVIPSHGGAGHARSSDFESKAVGGSKLLIEPHMAARSKTRTQTTQNKQMKRATHDGRATEGVTQNYHTSSQIYMGK